MKLLLDTHVWVWWFLSPDRLSSRAFAAMENPEYELLFSAASSWEISVKYALKKLRLPEPPARYIPTRLERGGVTPMAVEHAHALRVSELPHHHRDPFDRLLIAQAQLEGATLATADPMFLLYDVDLLWAGAGDPPLAVHDADGRRRKVTGSVDSSGLRRRTRSRAGSASRPSRARRGRKAK